LRRILLILRNDVKRRLKSPVTILVMLLIPMLMTGLIGMIFAPSNDGNSLPTIKVLFVDNDKNFISKFLLGAFDANEVKEMFQVTVVEEAEGRRLIGKGKASALVIIPEKFSNRLLKAEEVQVEVIKNPAEQFLPEIIEEFMLTFSVGVSALVQVFEPEIKAIDAMGDVALENTSMMQMVPFLENGRKKIVTLKQYIDPLLLKLKKEVTGKKKKEPIINVFGIILPGMAVMFFLFIIEIFMRDILTEREDGKFQRIMFSPIRSIEFILARIISGWVMGIMVCLIMVLTGTLIFKISWGNYVYLFLFVAVTSFWIASFFALLNAFFKNKNQAGALVSPIILVFSAFGGSMMPVNQLPESVRWVADFTLNQWFIKGVLLIQNGHFPSLPIAIILGTGSILFFAGTFFLRKRITV
jgi:linearmycin/streptolysin S transport system permease protein